MILTPVVVEVNWNGIVMKSERELGLTPCTEPGEYDEYPFTNKEVC